MHRKIRQFVQRNGGWYYAEGVGQLLTRWEAAAHQVALWRQEQIVLGEFGPDWVDATDRNTFNKP